MTFYLSISFDSASEHAGSNCSHKDRVHRHCFESTIFIERFVQLSFTTFEFYHYPPIHVKLEAEVMLFKSQFL